MERFILIPVGGAPFVPPRPTLTLEPAPEAIASPLRSVVAPTPAAAAVAAPAYREDNPLVLQLKEVSARSAASHGAFLNFSRSLEAAFSETLALQMDLLQQLSAGGIAVEPGRVLFPPPAVAPAPFIAQPVSPAPAYDRAMCLEFAVGSIAAMLGPDFA
jgi:hypothetical protein